jgi:hypothetical protein
MDLQYSRRKALKHLGLLMASVAGQEFLSTWLPSGRAFAENAEGMAGMHQSAPAEANRPYTPQFFTSEEFSTIDILSEMIIPRDDKPGARDARVADYIDFVVFSAADFEPSMQTEWKQGLALLDRLSKTEYDKPFTAISDEQQLKLLTAMSLAEADPKAKHKGFEFFRLVKDATVEAFYSSRVGLIEALDYKGLSYLKSFPGCTHPEHQS